MTYLLFQDLQFQKKILYFMIYCFLHNVMNIFLRRIFYEDSKKMSIKINLLKYFPRNKINYNKG